MTKSDRLTMMVWCFLIFMGGFVAGSNMAVLKEAHMYYEANISNVITAILLACFFAALVWADTLRNRW